MKKKQLNASTLKVILTIVFTLIALAGVALFNISKSQLQEFSAEVSKKVVDADASRNNLDTLKKIQTELEEQKEVIERTNSIVADSKSYMYQDQIIADLNDYASRAGINITNLDFSTGQADASGTPAAPAPATPGATIAPAPAGVKSSSVSITLQNPVEYNNILRFIKLIEQNLTKMQISNVSLSKDTAGSKVTSDALKIEVYVK